MLRRSDGFEKALVFSFSILSNTHCQDEDVHDVERSTYTLRLPCNFHNLINFLTLVELQNFCFKIQFIID